MVTFNGVTNIVDNTPLPQSAFSTDTCLTGGGAHFYNDWFYSNWYTNYPHYSGLHTNQLEIFTVYLSLQR